MKSSLTKARALFLSLVLLAAPGCGKESADFAFDQVQYAIVGGVAGFDRSLRIASDGSYRVEEAARTLRSGRLSGARLRELKALLKAVDWGSLKLQYRDGRVVDSLDQRLSVRTDQVEHVTTVGTGGDPPEPVAALLAFLSEVLREAYP